MSYEKDPPPLADASSEAPESLRALLRSARADLPTAAQLSSVEAKLGPLLGAGAAPSAPPAMGALGKAGIAALGGLLLAGGLYLATRPGPKPPEPAGTTPAPVETRAEPEKPQGASAREAAPAAPDTAPSTAIDTAKPGANVPPGAARPEGGAARPSLVPEDQLLERARRALSSDPNRALALTREHARSYPNGVLAQEREVIAIEALKRLGRSGEADTRRGSFEERYPQSAHRRNLDGPGKADAGK